MLVIDNQLKQETTISSHKIHVKEVNRWLSMQMSQNIIMLQYSK
jgi:hypothetical protein